MICTFSNLVTGGCYSFSGLFSWFGITFSSRVHSIGDYMVCCLDAIDLSLSYEVMIIIGLTILLTRACDFILQYTYRVIMILLCVFGNWNDENNSIHFSTLHCHIDASLSSDLFDITKFNFSITWQGRRIDDLLQACRAKKNVSHQSWTWLELTSSDGILKCMPVQFF